MDIIMLIKVGYLIGSEISDCISISSFIFEMQIPLHTSGTNSERRDGISISRAST